VVLASATTKTAAPSASLPVEPKVDLRSRPIPTVTAIPAERSPYGMLNTCVPTGGAWRCALGHLALRAEGVGATPAGPIGREEIPEFYTVNRTAILIVATLHVFGGFFLPGPWPRCARSSMPAARRRG
jgi:hypothetical protein